MIELKFLGAVEVLVEGQPVMAKLDRKELALLAYLTVEQRWVLRDKIVTLFWGHLPESNARHNLRQTMHHINSEMPGAIISQGRQSLALNPANYGHSDVAQFEESTRRHELERAVDLYRGPFLDGLSLKQEDEFEEWLREQRQRYERLMLESLIALIEMADAQKDINALEQYARRTLAVDPFQEGAYRGLMLALGRRGRYEEAVRVYNDCAAMLKQEFGESPSTETAAIHERLLLARAIPRHPLPFHAATFVGRERELAEATVHLLEPKCRLLTLLGPGGMGKTRLAIELARRSRRLFLHGLKYVALESQGRAVSEDALLALIAGGLGLRVSSNQLRRELLDYLRPRELLLVLDNFELFVPAAGGLTELLKEARDVKILATSRERLDIPDESLYRVGGMTYPTAGSGLGLPNTRKITSDEYDALALFARVAGQLDRGFSLAANLESVVEICRLVEGLPLAIEMVASWTLSMSCTDIARKLSAAMSELMKHERNFPDRRRSLSAAFEYSWNLLTPAEQPVFRRLAVIVGNISLPAAKAVAGATEPVLRSLVRKSMIETPKEKQYLLHSLVRAFALEKLQTDGELDDAQTAHYTYFAGYVGSRLPRLRGTSQLQALQELEEAFDNIQVAWQYGVERGSADTLSVLLDGIVQICTIRNWYALGIELFQCAADPLARRGMGALYARLLLGEGLLHFRLGNYDLAFARAAEGQARCEALGDEWGVAQAHYLSASVHYDLNRYDQAEQLLRQSLTRYFRLEDGEAIADCYVLLGHIISLRIFFRPEGKILRYKPPRAFFREHYPPSVWQKESAEAAIRTFTDALRLYREAGQLSGVGQSLHGLGYAHYVLHHYEAAAVNFQEAAAQFRELSAASDLTQAQHWLAHVLQWQGKMTDARRHFQEALNVGLAAHATKQLLDCLQKYALFLWVDEKEHFTPLAINVFVAQHLNTDGRMRVVAQEWVENISDFMREDEGQAAVARAITYGQQQTLVGLVSTLLDENRPPP